LSRERWAATGALLAGVAAYTAGAGYLWDAGLWPDVLFLSLVLFPATFAILWLLLPARDAPWLLPAGLTLVALAVLSRLLELDVLFNLSKLLALSLLGLWFLSWFENVLWAVLVAAIIPWVDAISVWRGPTQHVIEERPEIFTNVSIAFRVPGEDVSAHLGPPDVLFFALFLGAAARWRLRPGWTWVATTAFLAGTLILTATTDVSGLPALPAICLGFLLPNADLIWTTLRRRGRAPGRIYGRGAGDFYDLDADLVSKSPARIVLSTRERPARTAVVENGRLTIAGDDVGPVELHDLPNGVVVVPLGTTEHPVHPEHEAADEAKVERLIRERR
jgi:hypothetical protein